MKRVYLIRHGLPEFPEGRRQCIGSTDLPLSGEGMLQASEMARALSGVSAVFSSPLTRAVETARAIRSDFAILEGLRELDYGQWEGPGQRSILAAPRCGKPRSGTGPVFRRHGGSGPSQPRRSGGGGPRRHHRPVFGTRHRTVVQAGLL